MNKPPKARREADISQVILDERERWRRVYHPTRREKLADFWWAIGDEIKLWSKAFWGDLILPGIELLISGALTVVTIIGVGYLLALGFHLAN